MDPFERYLPELETAMRRITQPTDGQSEGLYKMLHYHLGWVNAKFEATHSRAGKRLRPIFLLLTCEAQGGEWQHALPAATAVELLHNFSLIHDDIEDRDEVRRGRPTLWTIWGIAQALNAGDALFTLAYRALFELYTVNLPSEWVQDALTCFNETTLKLTEGQHLDILFESVAEVAEVTYLTMVSGKTAALLSACCELGSLLACAMPERVAAMRAFGYNVGMAFQMEDDLLGLWGDPSQTGKPVGSDLIHHKKTLPILHGLSQSAELRDLLASPDLDESQVTRALDLLEATDSRTYTQERARVYHQEAQAALARSEGHGPAQETLQALAEKLLNRHT